MSKYDELKRLAEAANAIVGDVDFHFTIARAGGCDQAEVDAVAAFLGKTNPAAILELIAENERLREQCELNDLLHGTKGRERLAMLLKAESDRASHWKQLAKASRLLLEECNKVIAEDGGVHIELRAFLSGKIPASDVIALLKGGAK